MDANGKNQRRPHQEVAKMTALPRGPLAVTGLPSRLIGTGNYDIYVMDADGGGNQRRLTKRSPVMTLDPAWFDPAFAVEVVPFAVAPAEKKLTMWGWLKQVAR